MTRPHVSLLLNAGPHETWDNSGRKAKSNAQARHRGLRQVLVRGLIKVRVIALWHALAHNVLRTVVLRAAAAAPA